MAGRVVFNLNGTKFEISQKIFLKFLASGSIRLPEPKITECKSTEYFFERHGGSFVAILDYLQHGELHLPRSVCPTTFRRELQFWGVDSGVMSPCCYRTYLTFFDDEKVLSKFGSAKPKSLEKVQGCLPRMWRVLDDPSSSIAAKVYLGVSTTFVLLSLFVLVAGTHEEFHRDLDETEWTEYLGQERYSEFKPYLPIHKANNIISRLRREALCQCEDSDGTDKTNSSGPPPDSTKSIYSMYARVNYLVYIEMITMVYFTLELLLRMLCAPRKCKFFCNFLNVMDIIAVLSMYTNLVIMEVFPSEKYEDTVWDAIDCLQIVRVFRVFRIVKDVVGFRVLLHSVQSSFKEIVLLILYLSIGTVLFASAIYFLERENMQSIPDAAWWVVVTMTTVGYGDITPVTLQGKLVGCLCAICGVFLIAVTVPIFVSNFMLFYSYSRVVGQMKERKQGEVIKPDPEVVRSGSTLKNKIRPTDGVVVEDYM